MAAEMQGNKFIFMCFCRNLKHSTFFLLLSSSLVQLTTAAIATVGWRMFFFSARRHRFQVAVASQVVYNNLESQEREWPLRTESETVLLFLLFVASVVGRRAIGSTL